MNFKKSKQKWNLANLFCVKLDLLRININSSVLIINRLKFILKNRTKYHIKYFVIRNIALYLHYTS